MTEFPKAYYEAAGNMHDIHSALNTSYGDYSSSFWSMDEEEAKATIATTRRLIALREAQLEVAREALAAYSAAVKANGPRAYREFSVQSYEAKKAEVA